MNVKLEPDSKLQATLLSPVSPSQQTYMSGTNQSPPKSDLPGTKQSPKRTCVAKPEMYRAKKRDQTVRKL